MVVTYGFVHQEVACRIYFDNIKKLKNYVYDYLFSLFVSMIICEFIYQKAKGLYFYICYFSIVKRLQDKEKLKDFEKVKVQVDQLLEFKSRIMENQNLLQREVQRAKQEAREAIEARDIHAEEMADLAETVEMATLDKEMAEEKVG